MLDSVIDLTLYTINIYAAGFVVGRASKGFFSGEKHKEDKKWNTDPDVPVPHFETALSKAIQQDIDRVYAKEQMEAREIATGIVIDPGGTCLCRRCGHTLSALYDHCDNCQSKLDWNA